MGSKNACALEFACILGRNIKCSVIIIIIIHLHSSFTHSLTFFIHLHSSFTHSLSDNYNYQIVTRGSDQVAISSKFEKREDPGL